MPTLKRILTRMIPLWWLSSPRKLLLNDGVYTSEDKVRIFYTARVRYDEGMTPLYVDDSNPYSEYYESLVELYKVNPSYRDTIILDYNNNLKTYEPCQ